MSLTEEQLKYYFGSRATRTKYDYDSSGAILYQGYAIAGTPTSSNKWVIFKYSSNSNSSPVADDPLINVAWDDRASLAF